MKRFLPLVLVATAALLLALAPAGAGQYRTIHVTSGYQQPTYHQPHHRRIVNVVEIATVAAINPAYTSAYQPDGYDSATQADILAKLQLLSTRLDAQDRAVLAALRTKAAVPGTLPVVVIPPVTPGATPVVVPLPVAAPAKVLPTGAAGLAVLRTKCASCHQPPLAPEQRFTLLDPKGNLVTLTPAQKLKVLTRTYTQTMPPPTNLAGIAPVADAEFAALVELLNGG